MAKQIDISFLTDLLKELPNSTELAIAGGCIRSIYNNEKIEDYDIFCSSKKAIYELLSFLERHGDLVSSKWGFVEFLYKGKVIQVIKSKTYDLNSNDLIDSFDFTVCQAMVTLERGLVATDNFFKHCESKELIINTLKDPKHTSEKRVSKFLARGYTIAENQLNIIKEAAANSPQIAEYS